ncbi:MAG: L-lactate permease [Lentisphaerae bacterium]|nr:L-lactate permease [Lentisphaerota bacterium]
MYIFAALFPILFALVLLTVFKVTPGKALFPAWLLTGIAALWLWQMPAVPVLAASVLGVLKALDIILIIFGAVLLLNVLKSSGAIRTVNHSFSAISDDRRIQAMIVAWMFGGFVEGVSGFGAAPALAAPLMVGLGIPAATAVAAALICNTLSVPFAAAGLPVLTTIATLGGAVDDPARFTAALADKLTAVSGLAGLFIPLIMVIFMVCSSKQPGKLKAIGEITPLALFAGAAYIVPWRLTALYFGVELPSIMGAVIGLPLLIGAVKMRFLVPKQVWDFAADEKTVPPQGNESDTPLMPAWQAWLPYFALAASLLIFRFPLLPFKGWFNAVVLHIPDIFGVAGTGLSWRVLNNPGIMPFMMISLFSAWAWHLDSRKLRQVLASTVKQSGQAAVAIAASVAMVQVMVNSAENPAGIPGMLSCIARGTADLLGKYFIAGSPFIGMFGTFFSGSCTVSNILFAPLQFDTAQMLGLDTPLIIALQNIGGGLGSMLRISGVIAACAIVNARGKEGRIILLNCIPAFILAVLAIIFALVLY